MQSELEGTLPPVRLPLVLLDAVKKRAAQSDLSVSQAVRRALRAWLTMRPADPELAAVVALTPEQLDIEDAIAEAVSAAERGFGASPPIAPASVPASKRKKRREGQ